MSIRVAGNPSHHLNILKVGQKLVQRGHTFTLLLSSAQDPVSRKLLEARAGLSQDMHILYYEGSVPFQSRRLHSASRTVLAPHSAGGIRPEAQNALVTNCMSCGVHVCPRLRPLTVMVLLSVSGN